MLLGLGVVLIVGYRLDETIWRALMRTEPLLYDQVVMLRHAFVLLSDLLSLMVVVVIAFSALIAGAWIWLGLRLLRGLSRELHSEESAARSRFLHRLAALVLLLVLASAQTGGASSPRLVSLSIFSNVKRSLQLKQSLTKRVLESPYRDYSKLRLTRKPRVELFFIESYGRLLEDDPVLRSRYRVWLNQFESVLAERGLNSVSSFSEAPVSGGRSWIAEASVLMGMRIQHEVVFQDLVAQIKSVPHLVRFLEQQGYSTLLLAPADRVRLGVSDDNRYRYQHYVDFVELAYTGPAVGWGIVPDHLSLAYVETQVLPQLKKPVFFNFHTVTSHAPWSSIPDHRGSGGKTGVTYPLSLKGSQASSEASKRLLRLRRDKDHRFRFFGKLDSLKRQAYGDVIEYELAVISDYLARSDGDSLTIVMGDHQPPVVAEANDSFEVPIHVLSARAQLLTPFIQRGFGHGMMPSQAGSKAIRHEDLFALIVDALVSNSSASQAGVREQVDDAQE